MPSSGTAVDVGKPREDVLEPPRDRHTSQARSRGSIDQRQCRNEGDERRGGDELSAAEARSVALLRKADELRLLAGWLELEHISVTTNGDLAQELTKAVAATR